MFLCFLPCLFGDLNDFETMLFVAFHESGRVFCVRFLFPFCPIFGFFIISCWKGLREKKIGSFFNDDFDFETLSNGE